MGSATVARPGQRRVLGTRCKWALSEMQVLRARSQLLNTFNIEGGAGQAPRGPHRGLGICITAGRRDRWGDKLIRAGGHPGCAGIRASGAGRGQGRVLVASAVHCLGSIRRAACSEAPECLWQRPGWRGKAVTVEGPQTREVQSEEG